jgi:S1-C subfamily serine protease
MVWNSRLIRVLWIVWVVFWLGTRSSQLVRAQEPEATPLAEVSPFDIGRIRQATVFLMQAQRSGEALNITCFGSGTVVSRDGLVLTNAHTVVTGSSCPGDVILVALSAGDNAPPIPRYRAEVIQSNAGLDLALLRINREYDGRLLPADSLSLTYVDIADSSSVRLDDTITLVGYPGIGNDAVRQQIGTIVSFVAEPNAGSQAWMKSSVNIPATMSGGGAYNRDGQLIGIPTTAPINPSRPDSNCITLQDTNRDNSINSADICIPVGGLINTIRPSNFARPLFRAAQLNLDVENLTDTNVLPSTLPAGRPEVRRLFFSPSVNEAGLPTQVIRSLPAGSSSLYLFFDYANMSPETVYEVRVTTDGVSNQSLSLSPVRWSGGVSGMWYVGVTGQPIPNGTYEYTLLIDGVPLENSRLNVGGSADISPQFSDPIFGITDSQGSVSGNGYVLPVGNIASAIFIYRQMQADVTWAQLWYYQGVEIARTEQLWTDGANGAKTITIQDPAGLLPGRYRLELYIDGSLSATADFTIAGVQQGALPQVFSDALFTIAASPSEAATAPGVSTFARGENEIYFAFNWQNLAQGTPWMIRWRVDGNLFFEQTVPWAQATSGSKYLMRLSSRTGLPDGTYTVELFLGPLRLSETRARIGIGQLPLDPFAQTDGVQMRGRILDAETAQGIEGVTFILINELFSVADFVASYDMSMVTAIAVTDREGRFEITRPLSFATPYSVLIIADGYLPVQADGVSIDPADIPINLTISLLRG